VRDPSANVEDALACETGMLDIVLALGHRGTVNCDAVSGLLTEWLQDVSSAILAMLCLFALLLSFLFFFVSVPGYEID
jgi:hypothetical protein